MALYPLLQFCDKVVIVVIDVSLVGLMVVGHPDVSRVNPVIFIVPILSDVITRWYAIKCETVKFTRLSAIRNAVLYLGTNPGIQ